MGVGLTWNGGAIKIKIVEKKCHAQIEHAWLPFVIVFDFVNHTLAEEQ
jgi:hypothetical protein